MLQTCVCEVTISNVVWVTGSSASRFTWFFLILFRRILGLYFTIGHNCFV
jgi:fatty acid desaturase